MLKEGKTIDEIAEIRGLVSGSIAGHLAKIIESKEEAGENKEGECNSKEEISVGGLCKEEDNITKLESWYENIIYESTSFKAKKTASYILIGALSLLSFILILAKDF